MVGFFVGVAIGTASSEANSWILAAAAGVFLYIALVDLVSGAVTLAYFRCGELIFNYGVYCPLDEVASFH